MKRFLFCLSLFFAFPLHAIPYDPLGPCDCSGNGDPIHPKPFGYGDLVTSKSHPEYGTMFVTKIWQSGKAKTWMVKTIYGTENEPISYYTAKASDFVIYLDPVQGQ